jgi:group II intron reverse transcriptase/maturase
MGVRPQFDALTSRRTLYQAFERVKSRRGCRGCDGVTLGKFELDLERQLDRIQDRLLQRLYHPLPLLRFPIPKRSGGERFLSVPTVRDRVVQAAVYLVTKEIFEAEFEDCSHAYRPGRSVRTAVAQIRELRDAGYGWVVDADIDGFFDNIPHCLLLERLSFLGLEPYVMELFERWVRAEVYDGSQIVCLEQGIPQGAVVSPMLANLFLDELDERLEDLGLRSVRYGDDFLVLCREPDGAQEALELTDLVLEELELDLNRDKTLLTSFDQGFRFLGLIFLGDAIYQPFEERKKQENQAKLPPPLDLATYLELKHRR